MFASPALSSELPEHRSFWVRSKSLRKSRFSSASSLKENFCRWTKHSFGVGIFLRSVRCIRSSCKLIFGCNLVFRFEHLYCPGEVELQPHAPWFETLRLLFFHVAMKTRTLELEWTSIIRWLVILFSSGRIRPLLNTSIFGHVFVSLNMRASNFESVH